VSALAQPARTAVVARDRVTAAVRSSE